MTTDRYLQPKRRTNLFQELVVLATRAGLSVWGSRLLQVRGRTSGELRTTPVNLLSYQGEQYLVAPRGQTQWVRNLRAAGGHVQLRLGRRIEPVLATELTDADKPEILRAYLRRWKFEVGVFFDGVNAKASEQTLLDIAPGYPVFRLSPDTEAPAGEHAGSPTDASAH